jgi:ATP-dependent DNA helicase DinG
VLFATHSFWEGVDAPGDALQLLIICRLPFRVPTEPVLLARTEAVERRGGAPFFELSLPEAVMKLKQGFGRLMRRNSDRGVILITDKRIVTKAYGRSFINSLPPARLMTERAERLLEEIERVLFG